MSFIHGLQLIAAILTLVAIILQMTIH